MVNFQKDGGSKIEDDKNDFAHSHPKYDGMKTPKRPISEDNCLFQNPRSFELSVCEPIFLPAKIPG